MNRFLLILLSLSILTACQVDEKQPAAGNVQTDSTANRLYNAVMWQRISTEYRALCYQTYQQAGNVLIAAQPGKVTGKRKVESTGKPQAVIVDVDETILDNSAYEYQLLKTNTKYESGSWKAWVLEAAAPAVPGALEFCKLAESLDVHIIYLSNRKQDEVNATLKNLQELGFPYADSLHTYFKEDSSDKEARRLKVVEKYEVRMLIGDNMGDFAADFQDRSKENGFPAVDSLKNLFGVRYFILPNPMYGNWEDLLKAKY